MRDQTGQSSDTTPDPSATPSGGPRGASARRGGNSFPPADRIRKKSEYGTVFSDSRKVADRYFVCYLATQEQQGTKMGLAVSRKVGKAVTRNRVKRYLREFYRTHRSLLSPPCHFVVVARPEAAGLDYATCVQTMKRLLHRGGVMDG